MSTKNLSHYQLSGKSLHELKINNPYVEIHDIIKLTLLELYYIKNS